MASFDEVLKDCTKLGTKIPTSEYLENGKYPIIDQGQNDIAGYYDSDEGLFEDVPTIVFGDHTRVVKYVDKPCFLGADGVKLLCPVDKDINCKYLFYQLSYADIPNTGYNRHFKWVKALDFKIPSSDKQNHVVEVLDKVTELISLRKQQLAKLDELVKARFVEMFGDDIYPKVKVSRVCDFITKGTTPPNNLISEKYSSDKVPYLKVYNLSFTGKLLFDTAPQYVPENIHNGVLARSKVYPNDVLMNIVGPPLGKFALVTDEFSEWNINQAIAIFRAKEKVNPKYLLFALMQPEVLKPFLRQAVGIRQLNLSLAQCRDLEIPLPPLSLQSEFAAFVEHVDEQKQTVQQSLEKLELMKKALMQEYFG